MAILMLHSFKIIIIFFKNIQIIRIHLQGFMSSFYFILMDFYKVHSFFTFPIFNIDGVLQGSFILLFPNILLVVSI